MIYHSNSTVCDNVYITEYKIVKFVHYTKLYYTLHLTKLN